MKNTMEHLPENIQDELREVAKVCEEIPYVQMVILFGSFARGDWVDDMYVDEHKTTYRYQSDYDLLIVVRTENEARHCGINGKLEKKIKRLTGITKPLSVIYHGINYLNEQIEERSYFFYDIYNEGIMLYDTKESVLSKPQQISLKLRIEKAENYFDQWLESSKEFFWAYEQAFKNEKLKLAIFNLHQATERFFNTIQLVFTDYRPKTHDLEKLFQYSKISDPKFGAVFPLNTEEEKRLFKLLKDAYIDSRYKLNYSVEKSDLDYLEERVKLLQDMSEEICQQKLTEFRQEREAEIEKSRQDNLKAEINHD